MSHRDLRPYVIRTVARAARYCGFGSADKFRAWALEKGLLSPARQPGHFTIFRVSELEAALDAEATAGRAAAPSLPGAIGSPRPTTPPDGSRKRSGSRTR